MNRSQSMLDALRRFSGLRAAVLGDLMVDRFIYGEAERLSPEAPVPVVRVLRREVQPGGAANVGNNVLSLGASLELFGVLGKDEAGAEMMGLISHARAGLSGVLQIEGRPSTVKTRVVARSQHLLRVDDEETGLVGEDHTAELCEAVRRAMPELDVFIISDYAKGVITPALADCVVGECRERGIPLLVDPKPSNIDLFHGADLIKPNLGEALRLIGWEREARSEDMQEICRQILERVESKHVAVTAGSRGMFLLLEDGSFHHLPGHPREIFDVAGAGDSTLAAMALAVGAGADWVSACMLGNLAGSIAVGHLGVAAVSAIELERELEARHGSAGS